MKSSMLLMNVLAMAAIGEMQYVDEPMIITGRHSPSNLKAKIPYKVVHSGGTYIKEEHVGRNEPCPCGSGKKHKKCCKDKSDRA